MTNENNKLNQEEISENTEQLNSNETEVSQNILTQERPDEESGFEESEEDLSSWSKIDLYERLKKIIAEDKIEGSINTINSIKDLYRSHIKNENEDKLKEYLATGGLKEDFSGVRSEMDDSFEDLIKKFFKKRKEIKVQKEKQLILNLVIKKQIIEDLKQLAQTSENLSKAFEKFNELQAKWRETGKVPPADEENIWQNYRFQNELFFNTVNLNKELRDLDRAKNIELKTALCEKAESLSQEKIANKATRELKNIQEEWKDIGFIPKEENDALWERFKAAADVVYEKQKAQNEKTKVKLEENLKAKKLLCEELERLLEQSPSSHKEWKVESEKVEELMQKWKKISFVPKSDKGETWERFKALRNKFFKNKDAFYSQVKDVQYENLKIKISLCEKAEALKDSTDWENTANTLKRLQHEWKKSGPVSVKQSDKVWKRFRAACDTFFENKNKERAAENAQLNENLNKRKEIIKNLANLEVSESKEANMEAIKSIQNEFNEMGEISSRDSEAIAKNFNKAFDTAINKIKEKTGENQSELFNLRYESLLKTPEGQITIKKERSSIADKIKHIQAEVIQMENNMSFFSKSKNAQAMLADFQKKIDAGKVEIKKLNSELNRIPKV